MVPSMMRSLVTRLTNWAWLGTKYLVSKFLLNFHNSGINARMPIQSSQVRGGTLMSCGPGNLLVRQKTLQFHLGSQANRLKPITSPPVAQQYACADFVCIEI